MLRCVMVTRAAARRGRVALRSRREPAPPVQVDDIPGGCRMAMVTLSNGALHPIGELLFFIDEGEETDSASPDSRPGLFHSSGLCSFVVCGTGRARAGL